MCSRKVLRKFQKKVLRKVLRKYLKKCTKKRSKESTYDFCEIRSDIDCLSSACLLNLCLPTPTAPEVTIKTSLPLLTSWAAG